MNPVRKEKCNKYLLNENRRKQLINDHARIWSEPSSTHVSHAPALWQRLNIEDRAIPGIWKAAHRHIYSVNKYLLSTYYI